MEERCPPVFGLPREEQVRALGFDPAHLTADEQKEIIEMHRLCPDEVLTATA